jgi:hypothetical protein
MNRALERENRDHEYPDSRRAARLHAKAKTTSTRDQSVRGRTSPDVEPHLGRVVEDRYTLIEEIGPGSMSTVYRARQHGVRATDATTINTLSRA